MFLRPVELLLTFSWGCFCFSIGALPAVPTHIPFSCSAMSFGFSARGALTLFTLNFIKLFFILQLLLSLKLAEHRIRERKRERENVLFNVTIELCLALQRIRQVFRLFQPIFISFGLSPLRSFPFTFAHFMPFVCRDLLLAGFLLSLCELNLDLLFKRPLETTIHTASVSPI